VTVRLHLVSVKDGNEVDVECPEVPGQPKEQVLATVVSQWLSRFSSNNNCLHLSLDVIGELADADEKVRVSGCVPSIVVKGRNEDGIAVENVEPETCDVVGPSGQRHDLLFTRRINVPQRN